MRTAFLTLILFVPSFAAFAHHSFNAIYDNNRTIELEGTVTRVRWSNPHVHYTVRTTDGKAWTLEGDAVGILSRMRIPSDVIKVGDKVRLAGNPARSGDDEMFLTNALLPDGREVVFGLRARPRWTNRIIGTNDAWSAREGDASRPDLGVFRIWSTSFADSGSFPLFPEDVNAALAGTYPLTEMARARLEHFDPRTDVPTLNCAPLGMPYIMETPLPIELVDRGESIMIREEAYDRVRTIHMDPAAANAEAAPSLLGYSVGRWEEDTLVVHTTRANWGHFDTVGIPLSEHAEIVERFTPSENGSRLDYEMTITDAATFTEPVTLEKHWLWLPEAKIGRFECVSAQ
jgi:hypothetical protein